MAFITNKYISINNTPLDARYIAKESYAAKYDYLAVSSWVDASGCEHEEYYPNRRLYVTFNTSDMDETTLSSFISTFRSAYISGTQDVVVSAWVPGEQGYITQRCKVTGISPLIDSKHRNGNIYKGMTIELIGRGSAT